MGAGSCRETFVSILGDSDVGIEAIADLCGHREPSCGYDWVMFSKRTRVNRRGEAADRRQRQPEHPLDEIFQKDAKRIRRRHGWSAAVEVALAVLDMLPR